MFSSQNRQWLVACASVFAVAAICCLVSELFLRAFWTNPYNQKPLALDYGSYVRLQVPHANVRYDVSGLYGDLKNVTFRTANDGHVIGKKNESLPLYHIYGGSTTECRYVPEGGRWPELFNNASSKNYGVSGNNLIDSYFNFKYHIESGARPKAAVFMHAINDFSIRRVFTRQEYIAVLGASRQSNVEHPQRSSYTLDFAQTLYAIYFTDNNTHNRIVEGILSNRKKPLLELSEAKYQQFLSDEIRPFLINRTKILGIIHELALEKGIEMILVTQPNAYGKNYNPAGPVDLRDFPEIDNGYYLTYPQMHEVLRMINENTMIFAKTNNVRFFDVAAEFESIDVSKLFYDGVHYTHAGSNFFAEAINRFEISMNK